MATKKELEARAVALEKKRRASYRPSPPAYAGDAIDIKTLADVEAGKMRHDSTDYFPVEVVIRAMNRAYQSVGERAFSLYDWSPHSGTAIEEVKRLNSFENDCEDF